MKTKLILLAFLFFSLLNIKAQCVPVITSPRLGAQFADKILFCGTETETLSTTQVFATYQWYKQQWAWQLPNANPWVAVPAATSQNLTINGNDDMLYNFKVVVTQNDCTAESESVMADGFAYSLPAMLTTFTPGTFQQIDGGEFNVCTKAPVTFENVFPVLYGTHTWYKCTPGAIPPVAGDPCIVSGVSGSSYTTIESGSYGFYACTAYCPDQCEFLGLGGFIKLNYGSWGFCSLGTGETKQKQNTLQVYPNPTAQFIYIGKESDKVYKDISIIDISGKLVLQKKEHQYNQAIDVSRLVPGNYIIVSKDTEGNLYKNKFIKK
jgi:hypothetical protein